MLVFPNNITSFFVPFFVVFFFVAFIRAVKTGQYDDDYTPSVRMLFDDELVKKTSEKTIQIAEKQPKP